MDVFDFTDDDSEQEEEEEQVKERRTSPPPRRPPSAPAASPAPSSSATSNKKQKPRPLPTRKVGSPSPPPPAKRQQLRPPAPGSSPSPPNAAVPPRSAPPPSPSTGVSARDAPGGAAPRALPTTTTTGVRPPPLQPIVTAPAPTGSRGPAEANPQAQPSSSTQRADKIEELKALLASVTTVGTSPLLLRHRAADLTTLCASSLTRLLIARGVEGGRSLAALVFEKIGCALEQNVEDDEMCFCLLGALFLLLRDRSHLKYVQRNILSSLSKLLCQFEVEEKEEGSTDASQGGGVGGGKRKRENQGSSGKGSQDEDVSPGGKRVPKFGRRKIVQKGPKEEAREKVRALFEEYDVIEGASEELTTGELALRTLHRLLRDDEVGAISEDDAFDQSHDGLHLEGSESVDLASPSNVSHKSWPMLGRRRSLDASGSSSCTPPGSGLGGEGGDRWSSARDDPLDQQPGSNLWRIKESMRLEGTLPVLVRLVVRNTQDLMRVLGTSEPSCTYVEQLLLGLDILETASFISPENQRYLVGYRMPPCRTSKAGGGGGSQKRRKGGEGGVGGRSLISILLQVVKQINKEKGGAAGDGRMLDVLLGSMRVLVNLTHHTEEGTRVVLEEEGGFETLLECFIRRDRTGFIVQALRDAEDEDRGREQEGESAGGGSKKSATGGPRGPEKESFDAKILSLTVLTNCSEKDEDARDKLGKMGVTSITWVAKGPAAEVQDLTVACQTSTNAKGSKGPSSSFSSTTTTTTTMTVSVIRLLSRFLLILIRPFAHQFEKELVSEEAMARQGGASTNHMDDEPMTDTQTDALVIAAYTALLLGCIMKDHAANRRDVLSHLPNRSPYLLVRVLKAFLAFQSQMGVLTSLVLDPIVALIKEMEDMSGQPSAAVPLIESEETVEEHSITVVHSVHAPEPSLQPTPVQPPAQEVTTTSTTTKAAPRQQKMTAYMKRTAVAGDGAPAPPTEEADPRAVLPTTSPTKPTTTEATTRKRGRKESEGSPPTGSIRRSPRTVVNDQGASRSKSPPPPPQITSSPPARRGSPLPTKPRLSPGDGEKTSGSQGSKEGGDISSPQSKKSTVGGTGAVVRIRGGQQTPVKGGGRAPPPRPPPANGTVAAKRSTPTKVQAKVPTMSAATTAGAATKSSVSGGARKGAKPSKTKKKEEDTLSVFEFKD